MTADTLSPPNHFHALFQPRRRRLLLVFGLLLLIVIVLAAIESSWSPNIFPVRINGKIGYINASGKVVVQPQYLDAGRFEDGLAPVLVGNTWG